MAARKVQPVSDSTPDDLYGTAGDEGSGFAQGGPDLFGTEPDELIVTHEPDQLATLDIDVDEDTFPDGSAIYARFAIDCLKKLGKH